MTGHELTPQRGQMKNAKGNWLQFKGNAQQQWGKLTFDHLHVLAGRQDSGKAWRLQERTEAAAQ